jgi:hypothetical protein
MPRAPCINRIEAEEKGNLLAISVQGPDFQADDQRLPGDPRSLVFTFQEGQVIAGRAQRSETRRFDWSPGRCPLVSPGAAIGRLGRRRSARARRRGAYQATLQVVHRA